MSNKRDIVQRLRDYDECGDDDIDEAANEIEDLRRAYKRLREEISRLTAERDEARRLCCERAAMDEGGYVKHGTMLHFAESRGWDCFKEDGK